MKVSRKWKFGIALLVGAVGTIWLWVAYVPEHWMSRCSVIVNVDGHRVSAGAYYGIPTENEADQFLLVLVPGVGDYMLRFDGEDYREASSREFLCLLGHAWIFKSMQKGYFRQPLPSEGLNQMSFLSQGRRVNVQF